MRQLPKSLTAVVHLSLHYEDGKRGGGSSPAELLGQILDRVATLSPELQRVLMEFTCEVNEVEVDGQSPE